MIESIVSIGLFVGEKMEIKRNRILPTRPQGNEKRICIVTGVHGDELDGQYVCYKLIKEMNENNGNYLVSFTVPRGGLLELKYEIVDTEDQTTWDNSTVISLKGKSDESPGFAIAAVMIAILVAMFIIKKRS